MLYDITIGLYSVALRLALPFSTKARLMVRGRKAQRVVPTPHGQPCVVVHCASLGEFEQGRPLVEALRQRYPDARLVVTFFSPSGYEIRKNYDGADAVYYLPLDRPRAVRRFVEALRPTAVFLVKYEYWYHFLAASKAVGAKLYVVSAIFRPSMPFFKPTGGLFRRMLRWFDGVFVQDQASVDLLKGIGIESQVAGDTRFDRVAALAAGQGKELPEAAKFAENSFTVVCGSTWPADEELILEWARQRPDWKFVVAPHEIEQDRIEKFIEASGRKALRYTQKEQAEGGETLLVVDCIGVLSSLYRYGKLAYIGGGFGAGIHNTLEAAAWGVPVLFGPKYEKFREAVDLVACGGGASVSTADELVAAGDRMVQGGAAAGAYVESKIGATRRIMEHIEL